MYLGLQIKTMKKLLKIIKEYRTYLIIGVVVGLLLGIIFWRFYSNRTEQLTVEPAVIDNPFQKVNENFFLDLKGKKLEISKYISVYKLSKPSIERMVSFVKNYYEVNESLITENTLYLEFDNNTFLYDENSGIFYITSRNGLNLDMKINSVKDLNVFFRTYFGIGEVEVSKTERGEGTSYIYSGFFKENDTSFGSLYLQGNAFEIVIQEDNRLMSLSTLMYDTEKGLEFSQKMPSMILPDMIKIADYPKYVTRYTKDERYLNLSAIERESARLTLVEANDLIELNVFMNYQYPYVFPVYKILGTGKLANSKGDTYLSTIEIYYCAISSEYLRDRVVEETILMDPAPE